MTPKQRRQRIDQLRDEIGEPLIDEAVREVGAAVHSDISAKQHSKILLEEQYVAVLDALRERKNPTELLPWLNVPDDVKPYFEDVLKRFRLVYRRGQGKTVPKYMPMSLFEAKARTARWLADYLIGRGVNEDKAIELFALVNNLTSDKVRNAYRSSAQRNLAARRRRRPQS